MPGMFVYVDFQIAPSGTRWRVPATAVIFDTQGTRVATVAHGNTIRFQHVELGRDFGDAIDIQAGLHGNETIVAQPTVSLKEGQVVRPMPSPEPCAERAGRGLRPRFAALPRAASALSVVLAGCMVGPDYKRPPVVQPAGFKSQAASGDAPLDRAGVVAALSRARARSADRDGHRIEPDAAAGRGRGRPGARARACRAQLSRPDDLDQPHVHACSAPPRIATSTFTGATVGVAATVNDWLVPVDLTYEIDVWGRVRRGLESARAQAVASADDAAMVRLTVQTDVAQFYYTLRLLDAQIEILARDRRLLSRAGAHPVRAGQDRAGQPDRAGSSRCAAAGHAGAATGCPARARRPGTRAGDSLRPAGAVVLGRRQSAARGVAAGRSGGAAGDAAHAAAGRGRGGASGRRRQRADRRRDGGVLSDVLAGELRRDSRARTLRQPSRLAKPRRVDHPRRVAADLPGRPAQGQPRRRRGAAPADRRRLCQSGPDRVCRRRGRADRSARATPTRSPACAARSPRPASISASPRCSTRSASSTT